MNIASCNFQCFLGQTFNKINIDESTNKRKQSSKDATTISTKIANDPTFAKQLMEKAQQSKQEEVQKQLQSIGIESEMKISFNPNTIHITLSPKKGESPCCQLTFLLYWR